jgi:hypothetical protein
MYKRLYIRAIYKRLIVKTGGGTNATPQQTHSPYTSQEVSERDLQYNKASVLCRIHIRIDVFLLESPPRRQPTSEGVAELSGQQSL